MVAIRPELGCDLHDAVFWISVECPTIHPRGDCQSNGFHGRNHCVIRLIDAESTQILRKNASR